MFLGEKTSSAPLQQRVLRMIFVEHHHHTQIHLIRPHLHQPLEYEIFYRYDDNLRDFESGCEVSMIDDERNDLGYENDHDEVTEISRAVTSKCLSQSSSALQDGMRVDKIERNVSSK